MGGNGMVERADMVRVMYCSRLGLEAGGGVQSDLPLKGCLGGSGLFLKKMVDPK